MSAPLLVMGVGNLSRGDDALGPLFVERIGDVPGVERLVEHQLQVEHVFDLEGHERVLFVDVSASVAPPFELARVTPKRTIAASHALTPGELIGVATGMVDWVPEAWTLAIRGESFVLGDPIGARALRHLDAALTWFRSWVDPRALETWTIELEGLVQGVGMRPWVVREGRRLGLRGIVHNAPRGVRIRAEGPSTALLALVEALQRRPPPGTELRSVGIRGGGGPIAEGFRIAPSETAADRHLALVPDLGICPACLAESAGPGPYAGYAHTSCASCGPRASIVHTLPWDRDNSTLDAFPRCAACEATWRDEDDRRFHAEGSSCSRCGPGVWLLDADGARREEVDPVAVLAREILAGRIVAVMGVGAFHLAADATDAAVVAELRRRKHRETRPLAVMVADLDAARRLVDLDAEAEAILSGPARPIVIAPSRGVLPDAVAGGSARLGVMLPYTALHERLLRLVGRPLVMTSANRSGEPVPITIPDALASLRGIADGFCVHDRRIVRRMEDSVILAGASGPRLVRRGRGLAPRAIQLARAAPEPILALGGHLKATATIVVEDQAFVGPHLGDLDDADAEARFIEEVEGLERLLGVRCGVVAHDLHPDYASTRYALGRDGRRIGVQHHAAHAYAVLAEHGVEEPVVAVVIDGTGWGPDGTAWGAEVLVVDGAAWSRVGSTLPLSLPGGEAAIRSPVRAALGALVDTLGDEAPARMRRHRVFDALAEADRDVLVRMVQTGTSTVRARGLGRWFDAVGALVLGWSDAGHEARLAIALEELAGRGRVPAYPWGRTSEGWIDPRPMVLAVLDDLEAGVAPTYIAARVHELWVDALATRAGEALERAGLRRVVLGGGALLNDRLHDGLVARLGGDRVLTPRQVPANDGALSLGQAWAATMQLRGEV